MKKILRRAIPLLLALLMILGTVAGALSTLVYAAPVLVFDDSFKGDAELSPLTMDNFFDQTGTYSLKITDWSQKKLKVIFPDNSEGNDIGFSLSDPDNKILTVTLGGTEYSITKKGDASWGEGDKDQKISFAKVKQKTVASGSSDPNITYQKASRYQSYSSSSKDENGRDQSSISEITRNRDVNIFLDIVDPNYSYSDNPSSFTDPYIIIQSGSFKQVSEDDVSSNSVNKGTEIRGKTIGSDDNGNVKLSFDIIRLRYTGSGDTLKFTFGYYVDGEKVEYNASVTFPECEEYVKKPDKDDEDEETELDPLVPNIIVENYSYGDTQVTAGQTFPLTITFTNTSPGYDLENIIMKVSTGEGLTIASSSNTYYIAGLNRKDSITRTIDFRALADAKPGSHNVDIEYTFQYIANDARKSSTSKESIAIPVSQVDRFSVNPIEVSPYIYVGEEMSLSVNFVNKGRTVVYNVSAELQCDGVSNNGQKSFVGNMESGSENSADFFITPQEPGTLQGKVVITYEDANMNIKEVSMPFEAMVQGFDYPTEDPGLTPEIPAVNPEEPKKIDGTKIGLGFAGAVITGMTAFVTVKKIKAKRSGDEDEIL